MTYDDLARWGLQNIKEDRREPWRLVQLAIGTLDWLNDSFLPRCGSGGVELTDGETAVGRLIWDLAFFDCKGDQILESAAESLRKGEPVDWASLAHWEDLSTIRDDLDELPHPPKAGMRGRPEVPAVKARREKIMGLKKTKNLKPGEIAAELNIPVDTVKKDIKRARKS